MSYTGVGARARADLALRIVEERLKLTGVMATEKKFDRIGVDSVQRIPAAREMAEPPEVRIRVAGRTQSLEEARRIGREVETLYTNGPAGGGGGWASAREVIACASVLIPASMVETALHWDVVA